MIARLILSLTLVLTTFSAVSQTSSQIGSKSPAANSEASVAYPRLLNAAGAANVLPATVFFRGQSAAIQVRNSGGVEFAKGQYMLATLVDTSGYSTSVQERYQAYLLTEVPLIIDGKQLAPGAYGCGFIAGDRFVVMDIGGNEILAVSSTRDPALKRPTPLQILASPTKGSFRLMAGRTYVDFKAAGDEKR